MENSLKCSELSADWQTLLDLTFPDSMFPNAPTQLSNRKAFESQSNEMQVPSNQSPKVLLEAISKSNPAVKSELPSPPMKLEPIARQLLIEPAAKSVFLEVFPESFFNKQEQMTGGMKVDFSLGPQHAINMNAVNQNKMFVQVVNKPSLALETVDTSSLSEGALNLAIAEAVSKSTLSDVAKQDLADQTIQFASLDTIAKQDILVNENAAGSERLFNEPMRKRAYSECVSEMRNNPQSLRESRFFNVTSKTNNPERSPKAALEILTRSVPTSKRSRLDSICKSDLENTDSRDSFYDGNLDNADSRDSFYEGKQKTDSQQSLNLDKSTDEYRKRRERNNIAVRRSREKAKQRMLAKEDELKNLVKSNSILKKRCDILEKEIKIFRTVYDAFSPKVGSVWAEADRRLRLLREQEESLLSESQASTNNSEN